MAKPQTHLTVNDLTMLMTPATDEDHLHAWIERFTGLDIPRQTISRFANSNPFDFIWKAYRAIMDGKSAAIFSCAGRDSSKTLSLSIIDLLAFLHDHRQIVHVAMTMNQGSRARNYLEGFITKHPVIKNSIVKMNTSEIKIKIDDKTVGLEIVPATPKAVQGAHCSLLTFDEVASSMEPNNVRAYRDAHGIMGSSEKGKPAVIIKITSRQQGFSLAEEELRNAAKNGVEVLKWTTLDMMERCPDERSGTIPTPLWINPLKGDKYTEEEYDALEPHKKEGFQLTRDTFDLCRDCPLGSLCAGDSKKQQSTSVLLRTIDDVINKIRLAGSWDWGVAQIMSMKPESSALVYFEFDRQAHQLSWNELWKQLTGNDIPGEVNKERFVQELKRRNCQFIAGIDWGWSSPSTCVVVAIDAREQLYVIEAIGRTYTPDPEFIELIRTTLHRKYQIQMYCPDIANGSGNALLRQAGLPTTDEIDKSINLGINIVKGLLRVPGAARTMSRMFFSPELQSTIPNVHGIIEEFEFYHKKIDAAGKIQDDAEPEHEHCHYLDALRYLCFWVFGKMKMRVGSDYERKVQDKPKSNTPSLEEIARKYGLNFNDNRETTPEEEDQEALNQPVGPLWHWTGNT